MQAIQSAKLLALVALGVLACSPEAPQEEAPPPSGAPALYKITPTWCHGPCWSLTLYRNDTFIELRSHDRGDHTFLGLATGTLSEPANDELDQLLEQAINLGELPSGGGHDAPRIDLWLPGLHLSYDDGFPPTGLIELDAFLAKILDDMSQCHPTTQITPHDCEPLNWFPE